MPWSKAVPLPPSLQAKSHGIKVEEIQVPILMPQQPRASCAWWPLQNGSRRVWRLEVIKMVQGVLPWIWQLCSVGLLLKGSLCLRGVITCR